MQIAIKVSGIKPVSKLDPSAHIPADSAARAVAWLASDAGAPYASGDFSLKTEKSRKLVGLA
jgi:3-oxoacyl-[acyl-carrier protein] reductase